MRADGTVLFWDRSDRVAKQTLSQLALPGANTTDVQHDRYVTLSAAPDRIGSQTPYGLYVSLEYL